MTQAASARAANYVLTLTGTASLRPLRPVDAEHYPEQNEVPKQHPLVSDGPDVEKIKAHAYELWMERGCPHSSSDEDWHQAEREPRAKSGSRRISDQLHESSGSVQR